MLQQQLDKFAPAMPAHPDLPFQGGALGLFGYDLGRRVEKLPELAAHDIALPDMAIGLYDWALIADHSRQKLTLVSLGDAEQRLHWLHQQTTDENLVPFKLTVPWQADMSREQYGEKFRQIQAYLRSGDCYQINLAQRFSAEYQGDEWQAFLSLSRSNQAPFQLYSLTRQRHIECFTRTFLVVGESSGSNPAD